MGRKPKLNRTRSIQSRRSKSNPSQSGSEDDDIQEEGKERSSPMKRNSVWTGVVCMDTQGDKLIAPLNINSDMQLVDSLYNSYPEPNDNDWQLEFDPRAYGGPREDRGYLLEPLL